MYIYIYVHLSTFLLTIQNGFLLSTTQAHLKHIRRSVELIKTATDCFIVFHCIAPAMFTFIASHRINRMPSVLELARCTSPGIIFSTLHCSRMSGMGIYCHGHRHPSPAIAAVLQ